MTEEDLDRLKQQIKNEILTEMKNGELLNPPKPWDAVNRRVENYIQGVATDYFAAVKIKPLFTHAVRHVFRISHVKRLNMRDVERADKFAAELIALLKKYRNREDVEP